MNKPPPQRIRWYRSRYNRQMFLRVRTAPVPMLTVINVPGMIHECKRYSIDDNGKLTIDSPLYALAQTIDELFVPVTSRDLPYSVRMRATHV